MYLLGKAYRQRTCAVFPVKLLLLMVQRHLILQGRSDRINCFQVLTPAAMIPHCMTQLIQIFPFMMTATLKWTFFLICHSLLNMVYLSYQRNHEKTERDEYTDYARSMIHNAVKRKEW